MLGASSYTFAQATWTQSLPDWIAAHVAMLAFFGGTPRQIVSDNLRAGITRACFYEPQVNRTYADFASHYGLPKRWIVHAPSLGSAAAGDWRKIGNASIARRSTSCVSPLSASCCENYAIPHDVFPDNS